MRTGKPSRLRVWDLRDDDDYSAPTRRMIVVASSEEAAEAMWDHEPTADNVFVRPVDLKGYPLHLRMSEPRVLSSGPFTAPAFVEPSSDQPTTEAA